MTHRATAALADRIARLVKAPGNEVARNDIRDLCDIQTLGDFPPGELDRLTDMVHRRVLAA